MPPEITANIFCHCLPVDSSESPSPSKPPLLLAQICCRWREICISTPKLWTSIAFEKGAVELLELWLSRTGNYLLTISLRTREEPRACIFMQAIMQRCPQWHDVHLVLPLRALRPLSMSPFPRLRRLTLCAVGAEEWTRAPPIIIRETPLLRCVDIHFLPQVDLPLEQLTTLHFHHSLDVAQTLAILRCCRNLLDLCSLNLGIGSTIVSPPIELRFLRFLKIDDRRLLPGLTLPRLERLEMMGAIGEAVDALQALISRSSCDLRVLSLRIHQTTIPQMQSFLRTTSSVVHLTLDRAWLEFQMPALQGADILPRLQHLEIRYCGVGNEYRPLFDMLQWRQRRSLQSFELSLGHDRSLGPSPADVMREFRILGEAGLHVRVSKYEEILLDTGSISH
ncbi:hypothetical protein K438DRAFT_1771036 [Mycena galopus ATCC 62051]|nr:hypothetical protein K438DRAFT_1771036 [Mycena galopus ATCC 62051]